MPPPQPSLQPAIKSDSVPIRTNTTAAAAAAAAAVVAAAAAPVIRVFSGIPGGGPSPGSNGMPTYVAAAMKMDSQSSDKSSFLGSCGGLLKENSSVNSNVNYALSDSWRYGSLNSRLLLLSNNKDLSSENKPALDKRLGHQEGSCDVQEKTVDGRTSVCDAANKTDVGYGGHSLTSPALHPPANR